VLAHDEAARTAERFGVDDVQVRRDHLLSHLLSALSRQAADDVVFFGGTALARTHLPDGRLSEDVDLLARGPRADVAATVERVLALGARREYGRLGWQPALIAVRDTQPAVLVTGDGLSLRVQLLSSAGYPSWPTEWRWLEQRYSDAPPARLQVPTRPAFAAWKTVAWAERRLPRDLYDLWGLAEAGAIDAAARDLYATHGPTGRPPAPWLFDTAPSEPAWTVSLAGQTRVRVGAAEAAGRVRDAWQSA
jgi:Nucleotidyl transferase AbiEii toxin, Type IV TA system